MGRVGTRGDVVLDTFLSGRQLRVAPLGTSLLPEVCSQQANAPVWDRLCGRAKQGWGKANS